MNFFYVQSLRGDPSGSPQFKQFGEKHSLVCESFPQAGVVLGYSESELNSSEDRLLQYFLRRGENVYLSSGYIHNRAELVSRFRLSSASSDLEILVACYNKHGANIGLHLVGNWCFVHLNLESNQSLLVQGASGYMALYFHISKDWFICSDSLKPLLDSEYVPKCVDESRLLDMLAIISLEQDNRSAFEGIKLLNPGHRMWVRAQGVKRERYWFPENTVTNHNITMGEAVEELASLFKVAVKEGIGQESKVASMLSGGLDSSSVVAFAAELLAQKGQQLHTFSHVPLYKNADKLNLNRHFGDESVCIKSTATRYPNIVPQFLDSGGVAPLQGIKQLLEWFDFPVHGQSNAFWLVDLYQQAAQQGFKALLTGEMGNATISFKGLYRPTFSWTGFIANPRDGLKHLLRPSWHFVKRHYLERKSPDIWKTYCHLSPEVAEAVNLMRRIRASGRSVDFSHSFRSHQEFLLAILKPGGNPRLTLGHAVSSATGLRLCDPTGDSRIAEFMLSLPNHLFVDAKRQNKLLLKAMMKDRLPHDVLYNPRKGLQGSDNYLRARQDVAEMKQIIHDYEDDLFEVPLFDKRRMLDDCDRIERSELDVMACGHLLRSVGVMLFHRRWQKGLSAY